MSERISEKLIRWTSRCVTYGIVLVMLWILGTIFWKGVPAISWEFLTSYPHRGGAASGILPAIVGTGSLVLGTIAIALPLGMGSAVFLSEYARQGPFLRLTRLAITTRLLRLGRLVSFIIPPPILSGPAPAACPAVMVKPSNTALPSTLWLDTT